MDRSCHGVDPAPGEEPCHEGGCSLTPVTLVLVIGMQHVGQGSMSGRMFSRGEYTRN